MKPVTHLLMIAFVCVMVSACQKRFLNPDGNVLDPDAQNFIARRRITECGAKERHQ